jgi:hypothetical protein
MEQDREQQLGIRVALYRDGPHWAVWDDEELVCVCVYERGALEVQRRLETASPVHAAADVPPARRPSDHRRPFRRRDDTRRRPSERRY